MKKLIALIMSMFLLVGCFLMTACGGNDPDGPAEPPYNPALDVTNDAFYGNVLSSLEEVDSFTFNSQVSIVEGLEVESFNVSGGIDMSGLYPTVAVEYGETEAAYSTKTSFYLYQNNVYFADGFKGLESNNEWEYWYEVGTIDELFGYGDVGDDYGEMTWSGTVAQMVLAYFTGGSSGNDMLDEYLGTLEGIFAITEEDTNAAAKKMIDLFFTTTQTADGFAISYDNAKFKAFFTNLVTKNINEFIDIYVGEGTYLELKTQVLALLNKTVNEVYADLNESAGGTLNQTLITILTTALGMSEVEVEQMITAYLTMYGNVTIKNLIATFAEIEEARIDTIANNAFTVCETTTLFDVVGLMMGYEQAELAQLTASATAMVDVYADDFTAVLSIDANGNLTKLQIDVNTVYEDMAIVGEFTINFNQTVTGVATKVAEIQAGYEAQND